MGLLGTGNNDPFFYIIRPGDSLSAIARDVLGAVTQEQMAYKVREILTNNPHITDPNVIHPGQFIALVPPGREAVCRMEPRDLIGLEHAWRGLESREREVIEGNFDIVGHLTSMGLAVGDSGLYSGGEYFTQKLNVLKPPPPQFQIIDQLIFERVHRVWLDIRAETVRVASAQGLRVRRHRLIRLVKDAAAWETYTNRLQSYGRTVKAMLKGRSALNLLSYGISIKNVVEKWHTQERFKTLGRELGATLASGAGTPLAYWGCSAAFAAPSAGSSLLWCGVLVGGALGYGFGAGGAYLGEAVGSQGDKVYRADKALPVGELP